MTKKKSYPNFEIDPKTGRGLKKPCHVCESREMICLCVSLDPKEWKRRFVDAEGGRGTL